jgi:hypothetical protein
MSQSLNQGFSTELSRADGADFPAMAARNLQSVNFCFEEQSLTPGPSRDQLTLKLQAKRDEVTENAPDSGSTVGIPDFLMEKIVYRLPCLGGSIDWA